MVIVLFQMLCDCQEHISCWIHYDLPNGYYIAWLLRSCSYKVCISLKISVQGSFSYLSICQVPNLFPLIWPKHLYLVFFTRTFWPVYLTQTFWPVCLTKTLWPVYLTQTFWSVYFQHGTKSCTANLTQTFRPVCLWREFKHLTFSLGHVCWSVHESSKRSLFLCLDFLSVM